MILAPSKSSASCSVLTVASRLWTFCSGSQAFTPSISWERCVMVTQVSGFSLVSSACQVEQMFVLSSLMIFTKVVLRCESFFRR